MLRLVNRVSVNALLKTVIASMALTVMVVFSLGAWDSWGRLAAVGRIAAVANASGYIFTVLHNLRLDRSTTNRDLISDNQIATISPMLKQIRDAEMPALKASLAALEDADFPERQSAIAAFSQAIARLTALHQESDAAITQPKAQRRAALHTEFFNETSALMELLDKTSAQLTRSVKLEDSYIDQLMALKQLAWLARNAGGDAAVAVANTLIGQSTPADALAKYTANTIKAETAWTALEDIASGLPLPARFSAAVANAKLEFFGKDYAEKQMSILKTLSAGEKVNIKPNEWTPISSSKLATLLAVAEVSLDLAKEHAANLRTAALWKLWIQLGMLMAAIALVAGMMLMVSRRVTGPLRNIQQAMLKVAGGDFSVVLPGLDRKDEIGDVANAVERFKVLADEKARTEAAEAVQRQQVEADRLAQISQAEAAAQAKVADERAKIAEEQTQAVKALGVGLVKLSEGDLTFRLTSDFPEAYDELKENFNNTMVQLQETIRSLTESAREVTSASAEISDQHDRSVAAHRGTGGKPGRNLRFDGRDRRHGEEERRECAAGQCFGRCDARCRRSRRPGGRQGGRGHGQDRGILAQDLRHHRRHRRNRAADQPLGPQCRGGSRPRRRSRPWICRGGLGSAQPGAALLAGGERHQGPDHQLERPGQRRRRTRQSRRRLAHRDRRVDQEGGRNRRRHRHRQQRAGERHRAGQQGVERRWTR